MPSPADFDVRWVDMAVKFQDLEVVKNLAKPGHTGANDFLLASFEQSLKKKKTDLHEATEILNTMIRVQHPSAPTA